MRSWSIRTTSAALLRRYRKPLRCRLASAESAMPSYWRKSKRTTSTAGIVVLLVCCREQSNAIAHVGAKRVSTFGSARERTLARLKWRGDALRGRSGAKFSEQSARTVASGGVGRSPAGQEPASISLARADGRPSLGHPSRSRSGEIDAESAVRSVRKRAGGRGREAFGRATPILPPRPRLHLHLMQPRPPRTRRRSLRP